MERQIQWNAILRDKEVNPSATQPEIYEHCITTGHEDNYTNKQAQVSREAFLADSSPNVNAG